MSYEPGIYDLSNDEYHASPGVSRSALWTFKQLPALYEYQYLSGEYIREEKEAYVLGELVHTLVLEPQLFAEKFFVMPDCDRRTTIGKNLYTTAQMSAGSRVIIKQEVLDIANAMRDALIREPIIADILDGASCEKSIYWKDPKTGILCKCRPDIMQGVVVGDLKTTEDASYRSFQMSAIKYGYLMQAAMIEEGLRSIGVQMERFVFICVEKKPPYLVGIYMLDSDALSMARHQFHSVLESFAESVDKQDWRGYGVQLLKAPGWAFEEPCHG